MNPYDKLNIPNDARDADIKKAYRRAAQRAHPDREGGDKDEFHEVQLAYAVLSDPSRRDKYDRTGDVDEPVAARTMAENKLMELFNSIIKSEEFTGDLIETCRAKIRTVSMQISTALRKNDVRLMRLTRQIDRIKCAEGINFYQQLIEHEIDEITRTNDRMQNELSVLEDTEELIDFYTDEAPESAAPVMYVKKPEDVQWY